MLKMICSGGQTGADMGGLLAAKQMGITTGGYIPKGCITEDGPRPAIAKHFNLTETSTSRYEPRTYANAKLGDGTIRFATDWYSAGEICTLEAIEKYSKPYIDIDPTNPRPVSEVEKWIKDNNIKVLNVAGNRESKSPGICKFTREYIVKLIEATRPYT
jgi:hypothetical protein